MVTMSVPLVVMVGAVPPGHRTVPGQVMPKAPVVMILRRTGGNSQKIHHGGGEKSSSADRRFAVENYADCADK